MDPAPDPAFEPRPLDPKSLRVPVTAPLRRLPKEAREEILASRREQDERFRPLSPRTRIRLRNWVLGAAVFLPLLNVTLTPLSLGTIPWQVPVASLYGLLVGWTRPAPVVSGFALLATGWTCVALGGHPVISIGSRTLLQVSAALAYFILGIAVRSSEDA